MWKWLWWVIFVFLVAVIVIFSVFFYRANSYENFELRGEDCEHYYEKCFCFGSFAMRESYPPQYGCSWKEYCWNEDYTKGEC